MIGLTRLVGIDQREFEEFLVASRSSPESFDTVLKLQTVLESFATAPLFSASEANRRLSLLLRTAIIDSDQLIEAFLACGDRVAFLRSAVASYLSPNQRPRLIASGAESDLGSVANSAETNKSKSGDTEISSGISTAPATAEVQGSYKGTSIVLLVGDTAELETSKSLLKGYDIGFRICTSVDEALSTSRPQDICAIVVANSCCNGIAGNEQLALLQNLVRLSSQAWVKIGIASLATEHKSDLETFRQNLGYGVSRAENIHLEISAELTGTDLGYILPKARAFDAARETIFLADGISENQTLLIALAVNRELQLAGVKGRPLRKLTTRISGGRSGAKIVIIRGEGFRNPIVLRLHNRESILGPEYGELRRIQSYIVPWDSELNPNVYYLGNDAALIYRSIKDASTIESLAITLGDRIRLLQQGEVPDPPSGLPNPDDLTKAIEEAMQLLCSLNKTHPPSDEVGFGYDHILNHCSTNESNGKDICILEAGNKLSILPIVRSAVESVREKSNSAVTHGDPHIANILLPTDTHSELIDFEKTRPGHPLCDICHLLSSLTCSSYRLNELSFDIVEKVYECLFGDGYEKVVDGEASAVNKLMLRTCVIARKYAIELATEYDLKEEEFPSMLVLVATCVLLYLPHLNAEVAKILILAAKRELDQLQSTAR